MSNLPKQNENSPKRITWVLIWDDFLNVVNFEKGVLLTIKGLILKPKETVDDYLYGKRFLHANPLRFLLFSTAIVTLLNFYVIIKPSLANGKFNETEKGVTFKTGEGFDQSIGLEITQNDSIVSDSKQAQTTKSVSKEKQRQILNESIGNLMDWMDKFTFALVPIFALFTFLLFRKSGYNYTENLVINAFMISVTNVIGIIFIIPVYFSTAIGGGVLSLASLLFTVFYINRVFAFSGFKGWLRTLAAIILSYLLYIITIGVFLVYFVFDSMNHV